MQRQVIAIALFGRKNKDTVEEGNRSVGPAATFVRDPNKANQFFEHAETTADARQYDYSVECYVNGLKFDPENVAKHEALREVAIKRHVLGGKPVGIKERLTTGGKDLMSRLAHVKKVWAMDPMNVQALLTVMERTAEANQAIEELDLAELTYWFGRQVLEFNAGSKKPNKAVYLKARDLFAQVEAFDLAAEACRLALVLDPQSAELLDDLKDLEAERTMKDAGYAEAGEEGGFKRMVRDMDEQRTLAEDETIGKSESVLDGMIERRRSAYAQDPQDIDGLNKLVDSLEEKGTAEAEAEAIQILKKGFEQTGQYRYQTWIGDIQIRQRARALRSLQQQQQDQPDDLQLKKKYIEASRQQLLFELGQFEDRVKNYPTDLKLKYELGRRLFMAKRFDEAIAVFQQSKSDPKMRSASHEFIGRCFTEQDWLEEAIETLNEGLQAHVDKEDRLGMGLQYYLMDATERLARKEKSIDLARQAQKLASRILQTNIGYRDIRQRMDAIRSLVEELHK